MDSTEADDQFIFYVGQHEGQRALPVTGQVVQLAQKCNYDMLTTPITTPYFHSRVLSLLSSYLSQQSDPDGASSKLPTSFNCFPLIVPPLTAVDTPLVPDDSNSQLLAVSSTWIDLCSPDPMIADISRQVLYLEANYAAFCGFNNIIIPGPRSYHGKLQTSGLVKYARAIEEVFNIGNYLQVAIWMPIADIQDPEAESIIGDLGPFAREQYLDEIEDERPKRVDLFGSWDSWNVIRTMCKYNARLFVALSLPRHLPPMPIQSRWYSEPLRFLSLTTRDFQKNKKGYPVLSPSHQSLITRYMRLRSPPWVLLCDVGPIPLLNPQAIPISNSAVSSTILEPNTTVNPTPSEASHSAHTKKMKDPTPHLTYIRHLQKIQPPRDPLEKFAAGFQDYLQAPLQPLTDNLESITYEVFEKDPIKYDWYEHAIARALQDWIELGKHASSPDGKIVVAVVGAGRGPLVTRALKASQSVGVAIELWAVEKNPNAFVLLQRHNEQDWNHRVNLVKSDMRSWKGPVRSISHPQPFSPQSPTKGTVSQPPLTEPDPPIIIGQATTTGTSPTSSVYAPTLRPSTTQTAATSTTSPTASEIHGEALIASAPSLPSISTTILPTVMPLQTSQVQHTPIDILVSELLGSFGDNELSPECLDGVAPLLNPDYGISIPSSYTAFISPISAPKLHADIATRTSHDATAPETPYVVMLHAIDFLSTSPSLPLPSMPPAAGGAGAGGASSYAAAAAAGNRTVTTTPPPQPHKPNILPTWTFNHPTLHPLLESNVHNERFSHLRFRCQNRGVCHGLAGYFESVLYASPPESKIPANQKQKLQQNKTKFPNLNQPPETPIELSTNPLTMDKKSKDMISWFPIFFPLKTPLSFPDNSILETSMWRQTDGRKVWYEWMVEVFGPPAAPDSNGKGKVRLGGSELHSSRKGACMM
ncbi:MAG: Protein arginine N-methyltransferase 5 [Cirrosporium novae-zelandiae]|nr:MAG: Protein arginine N-methyltransferase 5 [Cirrosporium novae-zelandiae]KAI9735570.1 MAG: Protein arginine N-methyltransferase 5 [Cirrosporium novae-zelandiae]